MHNRIKRFGIEGTIIDDSKFIKAREMYEHLLISDMREKGYVPMLDVGPFWSTVWNGLSYDFKSSVYGVYVGKERACTIEGMDANGRFLLRSTLSDK
jgi:hypothetical protein